MDAASQPEDCAPHPVMVRPMLVITGASGNLGGMLARRLVAAGEPVRLLVRDPARAPALAGAEIAVGDYRDPASIADAIRPGDRVFMVSVHEGHDDRIEAHRAFIDAAHLRDPDLIAYLSMVNASYDSAFPHSRSHRATEEMLDDSGLPYAFLRMGLFLDDLPLWFDADGICRGPAGDGRVSLVTRDEIAEAAAAVLTGNGQAGETYDLTGPSAHTLGELAEIVSDVVGRPFAYEPGDREDWITGRLAAGKPRWDVESGIGSYDAVRLGELELSPGDVERLTSHAPRNPRTWVEQNADRFSVA